MLCYWYIMSLHQQTYAYYPLICQILYLQMLFYKLWWVTLFRWLMHKSYNDVKRHLVFPYIDGILPKGPYPPCLRMADRALLAGYPRYMSFILSYVTSPLHWCTTMASDRWITHTEANGVQSISMSWHHHEKPPLSTDSAASSKNQPQFLMGRFN